MSHLEHTTREKISGATVNAGVDPSNVVITKLKLGKNLKSLLDRRAKGLSAAEKEKESKFAAEDIMERTD